MPKVMIDGIEIDTRDATHFIEAYSIFDNTELRTSAGNGIKTFPIEISLIREVLSGNGYGGFAAIKTVAIFLIKAKKKLDESI